MKKGGQKQKGSAFERGIAGLFTEAYYPNGDGIIRRVPQSGGWDKKVVTGDLVPLKYKGNSLILDRTFPFSVECKNWKNIKHFFSGLYSQQSELYDWIDQATEDALLGSKYPLVIFKLYRAKNIGMTNGNTFSLLQYMFGDFIGCFFRLELEKSTKENEKLVLFLLSDFFEWIDWEVFKTTSHFKYIRSLMLKE